MSQDSKNLLLATQAAIKRAATICAESEGHGYKAIDASFKALAKVTEYVQEYDMAGQNFCEHCGRKGVSFETAGKTASYLSKILNDTVRLLEFHKGNADSRAEVKDSMTDLVKNLSSEQLATVLRWMDENSTEAPVQ